MYRYFGSYEKENVKLPTKKRLKEDNITKDNLTDFTRSGKISLALAFQTRLLAALTNPSFVNLKRTD